MALLVFAGLLLGIGSAVAVLYLGYLRGWSSYGPWRMNAAVGGDTANLYARAQVAVGGPLALPASEAAYLIAEQDSSGSPLRSWCRYRIEGGSLPAAWWSLTAYGENRYLIADAGGRYSYRSSEMPAEGRWSIVVAPDRQSGAWLPTGARRQRLILVLRLYQPHRDWLQQAAPQSFPLIARNGCRA